MTQSELAKTIGMKYQAYQRHESPGKTNLTLKTIAKIKKALEIESVTV